MHRFKKFILFSLTICMFSGNMLSVHATVDYKAEAEARKSLEITSNKIENWPRGPAIGAQSAILMEANTGTILYEKNIHDQLYPASTTKILTALIATEMCSMEDIVTYSKEAVFSVKRDESNIGMDAGESITAEQTLYAILVGSANEASNAIGEHISGSIDAFVKLMNERAKELGCKNTNFVTTNGCFDANHYTTAYDLALIAQRFFDNELLCKMSNTARYQIPPTATQPDDIWANSKNKLLAGKEFAYEPLVGSKTGFTSQTRQTLVSCAEKDGMKLICVIFKEESPYQFSDTIELFDYGFNNFQSINISEHETEYTIANNNFFDSESDIFGDSKPILTVNETDYIVIPKTVEFSDITSTLSYDPNKENSVAEVTYFYNNIEVGKASIDLAIEDDVVFDFENQTVDMAASEEQNEENVVFINIKKVLLCIIGIALLLMLIIFIRASIMNYQFAKRRNSRLRRKKRKKRPSSFDDFDF